MYLKYGEERSVKTSFLFFDFVKIFLCFTPIHEAKQKNIRSDVQDVPLLSGSLEYVSIK